MEPIKFEDNIREKLQEREISPSKTAWEKLATQLDTTSQKRNNKPHWHAIAAGFLGVLIIASFLYKGEEISTQNTPIIVDETKLNEAINPVENKKSIVFGDEETTNEVISELPTQEIVKKNKAIKNKEIAVSNEESASTRNDGQSKESIAVINNPEIKSSEEINKDEVFINSKVAEVVAQVQALQKSDNLVTSEEIDALLLSAQREIQSQKIANSTNKKVDATALLNVVESELEASFRDKVFEALGDGFEKVRTAVVDRNK